MLFFMIILNCEIACLLFQIQYILIIRVYINVIYIYYFTDKVWIQCCFVMQYIKFTSSQ